MDSRIEQALNHVEADRYYFTVAQGVDIYPAALRLAAAVEAHRTAMEQSWSADRERTVMYAALDAFLAALPAVPGEGTETT